MKYTPFHLLLVIILVFSSTFDSFSFESGWEQMSGNNYSYKLQKLIISDLISVQMSSDNNTMYTYHKDDILRFWDFKSGVLLDSVQFSTPDVFQFSEDGMTAIFAYNSTNSSVHPPNSLQNVKIYDLSTKKVISNTFFNTNDFSYTSNMGSYITISNNYYDYDYNRKELSIRASLVIAGGYQSDNKTYLCYQSTGFLAIEEISNSSVITKKQINNMYTPSFIHYNDTTILFCSHYDSHCFYRLQDSDQQYPGPASSSSYLKKSMSSKNEPSFLNAQFSNYYKYPQNMVETENYNNNLKIYRTIIKEVILIKELNRYIYYDLSVDSILSNVSITFPGYNPTEDMYSAHDVLVMLCGNTFYFNNIVSSTRIDTIASPVSVRSFTVTDNDKSILAWNTKGEIIVMDIARITPVKEEAIQNQENTVYPNPTTGIISLKNPDFQSGQLKIDLVDMTGNTLRVLYDNFYNQEKLSFDISNVPVGSYVITAHQNNKATSFKVVKE